MCGIIGYVGKSEAAPILLDGLKRLEYRGYDSAGLAIAKDGSIDIRRSMGKLVNLGALLGKEPVAGAVGLGHTRWATHGCPSELNAHPHSDCTRSLAVVHNGIIENYATLKSALTAQGHLFKSETDTEVVVHLIEEKLKRLMFGSSPAGAKPPEQLLFHAIRRALDDVRGAYALAVMWSGAPGVIIVAKTSSPLVVGLGDGEIFLASDVPAFLNYTRNAVFLEDGEMAVLKAGSADFFDTGGNSIQKPPLFIQWDQSMAEKGGFPHFMIKEIYEQPRAVANTLQGRLFPLNDGLLEREAGLKREMLGTISGVHIVACGTACHAGMIGKYMLERYARIPVQVEAASEFRYRDPLLTPSTLVIAISQSGETADTLAAMRLAKERGAKVLAICNTLGAAITRCADFNFYTRCGPECGVASTKAFIGQLVVLNILTIQAAVALGRMSEEDAQAWINELLRLPELIQAALGQEESIKAIAEDFCEAQDFLFIGRGINYPTALEGALKLKEISYIHAEGYPAGEMKHGPLALIDSKTPVLAVANHSNVFEKILSNIEEAKARGAKIIAVCTQGEKRLEGKADHRLELPPVSDPVSPIVNIIPLQLLAYHIARLRGCDVDQPRNLAKSVTVE